MGRPFKNKSDDFTIANDQTIQHLTELEIPKFMQITYQENINADKNGKPIYATADYVSNLPSPKGMKVVKTKPHTIRLVNTCPTCHKEGTPRIDKRPNHTDYHVYHGRLKQPQSTGRRDSYFLVYRHKIDGKTVTQSIVRFDENHGFFTKRGKLSTKLRDVMFPFCVGAMKNA